jgi:hypothetical protein
MLDGKRIEQLKKEIAAEVHSLCAIDKTSLGVQLLAAGNKEFGADNQSITLGGKNNKTVGFFLAITNPVRAQEAQEFWKHLEDKWNKQDAEDEKLAQEQEKRDRLLEQELMIKAVEAWDAALNHVETLEK